MNTNSGVVGRSLKEAWILEVVELPMHLQMLEKTFDPDRRRGEARIAEHS
jgi:hypothetical protein